MRHLAALKAALILPPALFAGIGNIFDDGVVAALPVIHISVLIGNQMLEITMSILISGVPEVLDHDR